MRSIKGFVVLQKRTFLDLVLDDFHANFIGCFGDLCSSGVTLQLVGSTDHNALSALHSEPAKVQNWIFAKKERVTKKTRHPVEFKWHPTFGTPGACLITSNHRNEFFLNSVTLDIPDQGHVHFICNSWVYPDTQRTFFSNKSYLPSATPRALLMLRNEELRKLQGNGTGERKKQERIYDYDVYNDLGDPDSGNEFRRKVLGGSEEFPYPRRCRTGRPPSKKDPTAESRLAMKSILNVYVPRDESFDHLKLSDFLSYGLKSIEQVTLPKLEALIKSTSNEFRSLKPLKMRFKTLTDSNTIKFDSFQEIMKHLKALFDSSRPLIDSTSNKLDSFQEIMKHLEALFVRTGNEFDSFQDIMNLYPDNSIPEAARPFHPLRRVRELVRAEGERLVKFPIPQVIESDIVAGRPDDEFAWRKDEEFARQMLSGLNPVMIQRLKRFPPSSELDPENYGPQESTITAADIQVNLDGLTVNEALREKKLFILDYHDVFMPYVDRINKLESTKIYATRTILFLKKDGTLKPVAIELSLPPTFRRVLTPAGEGTQGALWQLAKAYVVVNDSGYHQLISHWLRTHSITEPFVIATNRQLSAMHPIHKFLHPHFRDTMNINALGRQILINAGGLLERTVFPGRYAMEMSAIVYKNHWRFDQEGLPADLLKRGMAVEDKKAAHGLRLVIEDYPFAVDGLEIWSAIETWVNEYVSIYYETDGVVMNDTELQAWWNEIRNKGHEDMKNKPWWYKMENREELSKTLTTMIWVASALHAAVNFGQYPYGGYMPNRPALTRRPIPEKGSPEFSELAENPNSFFLKTVSNQFQTILGISLIEILSRHSRDEVYLGQRSDPRWTSDPEALGAFERFASKLKKIEENIMKRNRDARLKNRSGPAHVPYTLLYPDTSNVGGESGYELIGRGIPNSVSI